MSVFKLRLSLLVLLLLPLLVGLGLWQLSRYQQKLELEQTWEARKQLAPMPISRLNDYQDPLYLPIKVQGRFVSDTYFLLDNQVFNGQAGYELLMPFVTNEGQWILVNRGWLPSTGSREELPAAGIDNRQYELSGTIYRAMGKPFLLAEDQWQEGWPKVIQAVDYSRISSVLSQAIPPLLLVLNANEPGSLQVRPIKAVMSSAKHLGYALQWFTMALVLSGLYGIQIRKREQ
ncbi:SURF1 family protein [Endozoicomonas sp. Mp262]|uniref:SURF1 family protein n=1 Tax=Endozoicomonas sp. Mp262 TaxID=2919499 RepID=UPI0021DB3987